MFIHDTRTPEWTSPQLTQMHGQTITMRSQTTKKVSVLVLPTDRIWGWNSEILLLYWEARGHYGWSKALSQLVPACRQPPPPLSGLTWATAALSNVFPALKIIPSSPSATVLLSSHIYNICYINKFFVPQSLLYDFSYQHPGYSHGAVWFIRYCCFTAVLQLIHRWNIRHFYVCSFLSNGVWEKAVWEKVQQKGKNVFSP